MASFDLKFDEKMDTKLAEDYLQQNTEFHGVGCSDTGDILFDSYKNKICVSKFVDLGFFDVYEEESQKYLNLAEKLRENTELFCQLEILIRKIPMEDTRSFDLELIIQKFIYQGMYREAKGSTNYRQILMKSDSPLVSLGYVVQIRSGKVLILSEVETAVICKLFVDLCHQVGFSKVTLCLLPKDYKHSYISTTCLDLRKITALETGCLGVISERADVESAVDAFLFAPTRFPWQLKRIFVHESIYERFKKAMDWKCKVNTTDIESDLQKACSTAYTYENKMYLCDFVGDLKRLGDETLIEPYRTVKEVTSFLNKIDPFCVSIWSSDVAESNQLAHNVNSSIVWINGLGHFDYPRCAQAFFSNICLHDDMKRKTYYPKHDTVEFSALMKTREAWLKLDKHVRFTKVLNAFQEPSSDILSVEKLYDSDSTVYIGENGKKVCITVRKPVDYVTEKYIGDQDFQNYLKFIIDGGAICFEDTSDISEQEMAFYKQLEAIKAPVSLGLNNTYVFQKSHCSPLHYITKAIWTSIGTTFAN